MTFSFATGAVGAAGACPTGDWGVAWLLGDPDTGGAEVSLLAGAIGAFSDEGSEPLKRKYPPAATTATTMMVTIVLFTPLDIF